MSMKENLEQIRSEALAAIAADGADLEALRVKYLGKKGELTAVLRGMGQLTPEERPVVGQIALWLVRSPTRCAPISRRP